MKQHERSRFMHQHGLNMNGERQVLNPQRELCLPFSDTIQGYIAKYTAHTDIYIETFLLKYLGLRTLFCL